MAKKPTYAELKAQRDRLDKQLAELFEDTKADFKSRVSKEADELGIDVLELFGNRSKNGAGKSRNGGAVAVKYRDPKNPENTWSGRGRPARWLQEQIKKGKKQEDFRV
jgi:DNA-binding protein H-NS